MAGITPPPGYRPHVQVLLQADDAAIRSLHVALAETSPALNAHMLAKRLSGIVQGFDRRSLRLLMEFLVSTVQVWKKTRLPAEDFAKSIANALIADKAFALSQSDADRFSSRLPQFLTLENSIGITAKAFDVLSEHQRTYCNARIVSDIRTVFPDDIDSEPQNAVINHMLRIGYHENDEHQEFFVALDSGDLKHLKKQIERAERKAEALKRLLQSANITHLDVE
jgi:hypothetical protein